MQHLAAPLRKLELRHRSLRRIQAPARTLRLPFGAGPPLVRPVARTHPTPNVRQPVAGRVPAAMAMNENRTTSKLPRLDRGIPNIEENAQLGPRHRLGALCSTLHHFRARTRHIVERCDCKSLQRLEKYRARALPAA